ncbi:threonine synthase [Herbidospora daliensis]|uniref:threonine synthase n=1 Tax=Herbidospora daliensis TaxID=295585 RepID=UPI0007834029|nr:pyridoxal-phosphate dependent enzyme [Herbidospora daliensis]
MNRSPGEPITYDYGSELFPSELPTKMSMWRYARLLPLEPGRIAYPLPVGGTPLLAVGPLRRGMAMPRLHLKDETIGPSSSNKDRATALVIENGLRHGAKAITTASTGNAALSTCIGAAAAGMLAIIFVPFGCDLRKVALMAGTGAAVFEVARGYDAAVELSLAASREFGLVDRNTGINPLTVEAKKTVAFEIWEQLGRRAPDVVVIPVGDGTTLAGIAKGFRELIACGVVERSPRLIGVQAAACQPLVCAWEGRRPGAAELNAKGTSAAGIAVEVPSLGEQALADVKASGGAFLAVPEAAIASGRRSLASAGILAEEASAACQAGLMAALECGLVDRNELTVLLVTGRGLGVVPHHTKTQRLIVDGGGLVEVAAVIDRLLGS